jgi:primosomal protein N' (replication factor Y)
VAIASASWCRSAPANCRHRVGHGEAEAGIEQARTRLPDPAPLLQGELLASLQWLAGYLHAPLGDVLATALPAVLRRGEPLADTTRHGWRLAEAGCTALPAMRAGRPQALAALLADVRDEAWLDAEHAGWRAPMRGLRERGLVERVALTGKGSAAPTQPAPP